MAPKIQDVPPLAPLPTDAVIPPETVKPVKEQPAAVLPKTSVLPTATRGKRGRGLLRPILFIVGAVMVLGLAFFSVLRRLQEEAERKPIPKGKRPTA